MVAKVLLWRFAKVPGVVARVLLSVAMHCYGTRGGC